MINPFGNHQSAGKDDFTVAPHFDKAGFGGADLGPHTGKSKR